MSAVATAGAAAWVVPEILTAKPAAGASLSGTGGASGASVGVSTSASTGGGTPGADVSGSGGATVSADPSTANGTKPKALAFTGLDIKRDAEVGAALVAGGWAMQHWASRPKPAVAAEGPIARRESGSAGPAN